MPLYFELWDINTLHPDPETYKNLEKLGCKESRIGRIHLFFKLITELLPEILGILW